MIEQDYMIKLVTGNENVDPKEIINKEKHYRRGYHQGYCQAVEDFLSIKESPKTKETKFKEGQIYTDAKGNRAMYNAGQWVPLK